MYSNFLYFIFYKQSKFLIYLIRKYTSINILSNCELIYFDDFKQQQKASYKKICLNKVSFLFLCVISF